MLVVDYESVYKSIEIFEIDIKYAPISQSNSFEKILNKIYLQYI